jgi:hypothetical protein
MNRTIWISLLALICAVAPLPAQININLDGLAAKAKDVEDVTLDSSMLRLAGGFLSAAKTDEAKAKELIGGVKQLSVKSFEFDKEGQYSQADLHPIRVQLQAPGWAKIVSSQSNHGREGTEVYVKTEGGRTAGLVVLDYEPKELTVVNIVGSIDLERLAELGGHFGIPAVEIPSAGKKTPK